MKVRIHARRRRQFALKPPRMTNLTTHVALLLIKFTRLQRISTPSTVWSWSSVITTPVFWLCPRAARHLHHSQMQRQGLKTTCRLTDATERGGFVLWPAAPHCLSCS